MGAAALGIGHAISLDRTDDEMRRRAA